MGILSRLKTIMKANMNSLAVQSNDPEKEIDQYLRQLHIDLGAVKAETAAIVMNEQRAKRMLDECQSEINRLERYAQKSVEDGNEERAASFLEKKSQQLARLSELKTAYEQAASNAENIRLMQNKLVSDIGELEARRVKLKSKLAEANSLAGYPSAGNSAKGIAASFAEAEEKVNFAIDKAEALAELRAEEHGVDLDAKFAQLEKEYNNKVRSNEDELAALQDKVEKQNE